MTLYAGFFFMTKKQANEEKQMQYKKFVVALADEGQQEAELNRFLRGHRVVKVEQHFLADETGWAFLVSYLDGEQRESAPPAQRGSTERFDPAKELNTEEQQRYQRYAGIRLRLARRDNVKAFLVFTNRELGELAKAEQLTEQVLRALSGFGEQRMAQYGTEFLRMAEEEQQHETSVPFDGVDSPSGQPE